MEDRIDDILATPHGRDANGVTIGSSREGRPVRAHTFGTGPLRVSVIAGCHADEPVGPRLLRHLVAYLGGLSPSDPLLADFRWWIVPHVNPDGEERNRRWHGEADHAYDIGRYLAHVVREAPGDDVEFGFPAGPEDRDARPENLAVYDWWRTDPAPFVLHLTLHGMAFAAGPWFLLEEAWRDRVDLLRARCLERVEALGYVVHDVERLGEKGFVRLGKGFCTRPDSVNMRKYFQDAGDDVTAALFRPSSMETIRVLGGDPLTLVSEMPLFLTPGVGEVLGPPDPAAVQWKERIASWRAVVGGPGGEDEVRFRAEAAGLRGMPVIDQMRLQWQLVCAGIEQVGRDGGA